MTKPYLLALAWPGLCLAIDIKFYSISMYILSNMISSGFEIHSNISLIIQLMQTLATSVGNT